nr:unnamed protein product [Spirometra erinaceieuropaei]
MSVNCVAVLRLPLLLVFLSLILLLNVPTPQAASTERIWLDEAEEGRLQAGEEDDALDAVDRPEEGEEVEEPGRASNPLAPAGCLDCACYEDGASVFSVFNAYKDDDKNKEDETEGEEEVQFKKNVVVPGFEPVKA